MTTDDKPSRVFRLKGELDFARQGELDAIAAAAASGKDAILDMTEVTFLDSTALNWLVRTKHTLESKSGRLRVVAPEGVVTRLLSITGLEEAINVIASQPEAPESP